MRRSIQDAACAKISSSALPQAGMLAPLLSLSKVYDELVVYTKISVVTASEQACQPPRGGRKRCKALQRAPITDKCSLSLVRLVKAMELGRLGSALEQQCAVIY